MEVYLVPVGDERYECTARCPTSPRCRRISRRPAGFVARMRRRSPDCSPKRNASAGRRRGASRRRVDGTGQVARRCAGSPKALPSSGCSGTCAGRPTPPLLSRRPHRAGCHRPAARSTRARSRSAPVLAGDRLGLFVLSGLLDAPARPQRPRVLLRLPARRPLSVDDGRAPRSRNRALAQRAERAARRAPASHRPG